MLGEIPFKVKKRTYQTPKEITLKDYEQKANAVIELGFNVIEKNLGRIILALIEEIRRLKNQKQSGV